MKLKLSEYQNECLTFEKFYRSYEAIILWFQEEKYIHNQLRMKYLPKKIWLNGRYEGEIGLKLNWKILIYAEKNLHTFIYL